MRQAVVAGVITILCAGQTYADRGKPGPGKCAPVLAHTSAEASGFFIASDKLRVLKEARSFAYRVATDKVVRQLDRAKLVCPQGCVAGEIGVTTGVDDSRLCLHGVLGAGRDDERSRQGWRRACINTLDYAKQCDSAEVEADKPAWAERGLAMWGKQTLDCKCAR